MNCLREKLQEEVRTDLRPVQLLNTPGVLYQEPTVNDGLHYNFTVEPTASLGGQQQQYNSPDQRSETNDGEAEDPIDSDPESRDSEHSGGEDDSENPCKDQHTEGPYRNKRKLSDQSTTEVSGTKVLLATNHFHSRSSTAKQAEFDPAELVKKKEGTFTAPAVIMDYLEKRIKQCLTKDEREALIKDHPKPDSPSCKVPAVDKFLKEFLDKRFPKEEDGELAKIQAANLLPICPLAFVWNSLLESGADKDPDMLVPVTDVISMIQRTICLIGNVSEFISQIRRTKILEKLDAF